MKFAFGKNLEQQFVSNISIFSNFTQELYRTFNVVLKSSHLVVITKNCYEKFYVSAFSEKFRRSRKLSQFLCELIKRKFFFVFQKTFRILCDDIQSQQTI